MITLHIPLQEIELGQLTPKPEQLLKWVNKRQIGSICKHAKKILLLLKTYNRCQATANERYEFIKSLTPVVEDALLSLLDSSQMQNTSTKTKHSTADMILQFYSELAICNKIILTETLTDNPGKKDKERIGKLVFYTLYFLSKQLLLSYHFLKVEPKGVWGEVHRLYRYAEQSGCLHTTQYYNSTDSTASSVSSLYKKICLLSIGNPYTLMPGEALKIFNRLDDFIESIAVVSQLKFKGRQDSYYCNLNSEQSPLFNLSEQTVDAESIRIFDLEPLLDEMKRVITSLHSPDNQRKISIIDRMEREMLQRLTNAWTCRVGRQHTREPADAQVLVVSGLSPSHHFICGQKYFEPEYEEISFYRPSAIKESSFSLLPQEYEPWKAEDIAGKIETGMLHPRYSKYCDDLDIWKKTLATRSQARVQYDTKVKDYTAQIWQQVDNSSGGIGLRREFACDIHVGEIVSYKFDDATDEQQWNVGIVRWLRENEDRQFEMGIMNLPPVLKSTAVRAIDGAGKGSEYFRSLLLFDNTSKLTSIIVPANIYDTGTQLIMNAKTGLTYIQLENVVQTTSSFSHFNFKEIPIPLSEKYKIRSLRNSEHLNVPNVRTVA